MAEEKNNVKIQITETNTKETNTKETNTEETNTEETNTKETNTKETNTKEKKDTDAKETDKKNKDNEHAQKGADNEQQIPIQNETEKEFDKIIQSNLEQQEREQKQREDKNKKEIELIENKRIAKEKRLQIPHIIISRAPSPISKPFLQDRIHPRKNNIREHKIILEPIRSQQKQQLPIDEKGRFKFNSKKITYKEVEQELNNTYHSYNEYFSCAMDILASFVKGQKIIYMEAESLCQ